MIKEHAVAVSNDLRAGKIMENNLLDRLAEDGRLGIDRADLQAIFDSNSSATGMADAQVEAFRSMVQELTDRFPNGAGYQPETSCKGAVRFGTHFIPRLPRRRPSGRRPFLCRMRTCFFNFFTSGELDESEGCQ